MNKNILTCAILFITINMAFAEEKNILDTMGEKVIATWQRLKERAQGTIDEITQQKANELKQEILGHIKDEPYYTKAIEQNPGDIIAWIILKGYELPKHTLKTAYSHYLAGEQNMKLRHWQKAMSLANQELNDAHERAKSRPAA